MTTAKPVRRERGFYWVRVNGKRVVALYTVVGGNWYWYVPGLYYPQDVRAVLSDRLVPPEPAKRRKAKRA